MTTIINHIITSGNTTFGGGTGKLVIHSVTCENTCTLTFESPLGTMFTIGNLLDESMNHINFSKNMTLLQQYEVLFQIYEDNTLALTNGIGGLADPAV